ncbi:hypothetical protein AMECASPLE_023483 [Ameca splendens]|uniref:Uncharacterized protein n=1 Tax=Ameca splendens TaxID=208324 RepID=A0ABV0YFJ6_9TELE
MPTLTITMETSVSRINSMEKNRSRQGVVGMYVCVCFIILNSRLNDTYCNNFILIDPYRCAEKIITSQCEDISEAHKFAFPRWSLRKRMIFWISEIEASGQRQPYLTFMLVLQDGSAEPRMRSSLCAARRLKRFPVVAHILCGSNITALQHKCPSLSLCRVSTQEEINSQCRSNLAFQSMS